MRRSRLEDRLSALEKASGRADALIEIFGITMTQAAFDRIMKAAEGTTILPVKDLPPDEEC